MGSHDGLVRQPASLDMRTVQVGGLHRSSCLVDNRLLASLCQLNVAFPAVPHFMSEIWSKSTSCIQLLGGVQMEKVHRVQT